MTNPMATLSPSGDRVSTRQDRLHRDVRDLLAWMFAKGLPANEMLPIPTNAVEIKITEARRHVMRGGAGFVRHGGSDSPRYFTHLDDPEWAVVYAHDCDGDPSRGEQIVATERAR